MNLDLSYGKKISDVQEQFSAYFPFLKIEFFKHRHRPLQGSPAKEEWDVDTYLHHIRPCAGEQYFQFNGGITVAAFEQSMQAACGLPVQVFRKAGNIWLETMQTDKISLQKQNTIGERTALRQPINFYTLFL